MSPLLISSMTESLKSKLTSLPFLFRQSCFFCVSMLTKICLIFGQLILGREIILHYSQRTSIADGGEVEKPPPGNRSSLFIQRLKIYSDVQKSSFRPNQSWQAICCRLLQRPAPLLAILLLCVRFYWLPSLYVILCLLPTTVTVWFFVKSPCWKEEVSTFISLGKSYAKVNK